MRRSFIVPPQPSQAPGGVPRSLLAGIAGVIAVLALAVGWLTGDDHPASITADARAREQLEKPDTVRAQPRGSTRAVDEAAERAVQASRLAAARAVAQSAPEITGEAGWGGRLGGRDGAAASAGASSSSEVALVAPPSLRESREGGAEPGYAAREMEARSAEGRIFDGSGPDAAAPMRGAPQPAAVAFAPEVVAHGAGGGLDAPPAAIDAAGADLEHVAATLRRLAPAPAADAAQRDEAWQARVATAPVGTGALAPRPSVGAFVIDEGTVIPAVLTRRISTDAPGVVTAMVSMDVYDSRTARALLLPKGARLVGRYNSDVAAGQARLQFAFTRLILPDGSSFDLPGAVGSDAAGQGGLEADVDRHVLQSFGAALLIGVIADRVVRPEAAPAPGTYGGGLSATGQVLVDTANAALQRSAAIAPTLTVDEGARLNVEVARDLVFPKPYRMPS
jgi:type IV secretion system protein VirB10